MPDSATYRPAPPRAAAAGSVSETDSPVPAAPDSAAVGPSAAGAAGPLAASGADSLRAQGSDSVSFGPADSLASSLFGGALCVDEPFAGTDSLAAWRAAAPSAVYGAQSVAVAPDPVCVEARASLVRNAAFEGAVLLLAGLYVMLLYRNLGDVRGLLTRISRDAASAERLSEDPGRSGFARFLRLSVAIGLLFLGLAAVKGADELLPPAGAAALAPPLVRALPLLATLLCAAVAGFRIASLRLAGAVTRTQPFVGQLLLVGRIYLSLAVVVVVPALVLYALCPRGEGSVWLCLTAGGLAVVGMLYLRETLHLFLGKKISILHWFLYLCIVEIFPVSLVWLLLAGAPQS